MSHYRVIWFTSILQTSTATHYFLTSPFVFAVVLSWKEQDIHGDYVRHSMTSCAPGPMPIVVELYSHRSPPTCSFFSRSCHTVMIIFFNLFCSYKHWLLSVFCTITNAEAIFVLSLYIDGLPMPGLASILTRFYIQQEQWQPLCIIYEASHTRQERTAAWLIEICMNLFGRLSSSPVRSGNCKPLTPMIESRDSQDYRTERNEFCCRNKHK